MCIRLTVLKMSPRDHGVANTVNLVKWVRTSNEEGMTAGLNQQKSWPTYNLKQQTKQILKVSSSSTSSGMDNLGIILSLNRTLTLQLGQETLPSGPLLRINQLLKQRVWNPCRHSTNIAMKCPYSISSWHIEQYSLRNSRDESNESLTSSFLNRFLINGRISTTIIAHSNLPSVPNCLKQSNFCFLQHASYASSS